MESYDRFKALCDAHGISPRQLGIKLDISGATFTHWKQGRYIPKYDKLTKIAEYFNVDVDFILEGKTEDEITKARLEMRDEEKALASLAKDANPEQIKLAITFLKTIMGE
ncbi:MAG: helix-turn-helix transcriptional regulator [Clostridiales bacterium]|nr:helix-turn-helix transcriptional regulator [Clostridiales bacterium]MBQ1573141.1 helix-turn-helix transcriptional regulator [Clostridiales bacterium]